MTAASRAAGQRVVDLLKMHDLGSLVVDTEETVTGDHRLTIRVWVPADRLERELRRLGADAAPPLGWDARTLAALGVGSRWSRVWPFLIALPVGFALGIGITWAIARWL